MAVMNRQSFEKSWDYERFSRLYQSTSEALEWVEERCSRFHVTDRTETRVCLAVLEEDLNTLVAEFEHRLFALEAPTSELISKALCVLEEVHRFRRSEMRGKLLPFPPQTGNEPA